MTIGGSKFEEKDALAEVFDNHAVRWVADLSFQVLDPINQNPKYFLKIRPCVRVHIPWITWTESLHES